MRPIDHKVEKQHIRQPFKNLKSGTQRTNFTQSLQNSKAIRKFRNIQQQQTTKKQKNSPPKQIPANTKSQLTIMVSWLLLY